MAVVTDRKMGSCSNESTNESSPLIPKDSRADEYYYFLNRSAESYEQTNGNKDVLIHMVPNGSDDRDFPSIPVIVSKAADVIFTLLYHLT